jgi:hypothetical protein
MKTLVVVASLSVLCCTPVVAADGHVSHSSLAKMGLFRMQSMSDARGLSIRGRSLIGNLNSSLQMELQYAQQTESQFRDLLSNVAKTIASTKASIIGNIKN